MDRGGVDLLRRLDALGKQADELSPHYKFDWSFEDGHLRVKLRQKYPGAEEEAACRERERSRMLTPRWRRHGHNRPMPGGVKPSAHEPPEARRTNTDSTRVAGGSLFRDLLQRFALALLRRVLESGLDALLQARALIDTGERYTLTDVCERRGISLEELVGEDE